MKKILLLFLLILCGTVVYANDIDVKYSDGIYSIKLSGKLMKKKIKFVSSDKLVTNKEIHKKYKSQLTINTGFFDPKNEKTISYIFSDGKMIEDPTTNENLLLNPVLAENMDKILNRSEFRITECNRKLKYSIVPHNTPVDYSCKIIESAQGGPQILPELRLEEEFFILKNDEGNIIRQSASVLDRTARTIIGLKNDDVYILIITNKNPKNIFEVRNLCKSMGLESAMAFDGGSSTSLNYKKRINVTSTQFGLADTGRKLKSFMIIK